MPIAAVLTRASRCCYLRQSQSSYGRAYLGAFYVLSQCYGILPIYKPSTYPVKESRLFFANVPVWVSALSSLFALELRHSSKTTLAPSAGISLKWRCFLTLHGMAAP